MPETKPRSTTAETRKRQSRAALRAALLELLGEKPFDQIMITEITIRAKVGYATFFRHYERKEDILSEIAAEQIADLLGMSIPVMLSADSAQSTLALCRFVDQRRSLWRTLLTGGAAASVRAEFVRQARSWSIAHAEGRLSPDVPLDLGTVCAAGSTIDALAWWLEQAPGMSSEQIAGYIDRLIIRPFVQPDGQPGTAQDDGDRR